MSVKTGCSVPENFPKLLWATCELPELRWNINPLPIVSPPKLGQILMKLRDPTTRNSARLNLTWQSDAGSPDELLAGTSYTTPCVALPLSQRGRFSKKQGETRANLDTAWPVSGTSHVVSSFPSGLIWTTVPSGVGNGAVDCTIHRSPFRPRLRHSRGIANARMPLLPLRISVESLFDFMQQIHQHSRFVFNNRYTTNNDVYRQQLSVLALRKSVLPQREERSTVLNFEPKNRDIETPL
ncbi:hypothetical protein K0M31_011910 [Melipona bicolor]|uniref:Uncharacterized protein n=1 Tax=Melipona bicolor TaxID=60889 RepID=A0AA40GAG3_9HYME|nr:hypothetical protein K0M31_011910 [Melipona bicolor]